MSELFSHGQHDDLGGGQFRTTLGLRPVNYLSGGVYLPIANNWIDGDQDNPHVVSTSPLRVRADGAGRRNLYPIPGNDTVYISIGRPWYQPGGVGWAIVPLNPLERANNRLQSINGNYNLYLDHAGHYAKLGILLKNGFVPPNSRFAFPAELVGLTRQGSTILHNGQVVMTIRPPVVYDWQNPDDVRPITFQFTNFGGQPGVIFNLPNLAGMGLPLVDPTLTLQPGAGDGKDAFIQNVSTTANNGAATIWDTGEDNAAARVRRAFIQFDLSSIPAGATVVSSTFSPYLTAEFSDNATTLRLYRMIRAWVEGTGNNSASGDGVTWITYDGVNNWTAAGGFDPADCEQTGIGSRAFSATETLNEFKDFVLTPSAVQAWISGAFTNNGLMLKADTELNNLYRFASSDHATAAIWPKLVTEYTLPAGGIFWPGVLRSAVFDGAIVR